MNVSELTKARDVNAQMQEIDSFVQEVRQLALKGQPLPGKVIKGGGANIFLSAPGGHRRSMVAASASVEVSKTLRSDFLLAIKHPNVFAGLLPLLAERFECCATVRNPLAVLASWETIEAPVHRGRAPYAEAIDPDLRATLDSLPGVIDRQLALLEWYFQTFTSTLPRDRVIRYEDVISSNGSTLSQLIPEAAELPNIMSQPLASRNQNPIYGNGEHLSRCAEALLERDDHACWKLYDQSEVRELCEATRNRRAGPPPSSYR